MKLRRCVFNFKVALVIIMIAGCNFACMAVRRPKVIAATDSTEKTTVLDEIVVRPGKIKYSKKNNPAVDLMQEIRKNADKYNPVNSPFYSYDFYDKIVLALNNADPSDKIWRKMPFLKAYGDTAIQTGRPIINISLKEKSGTRLMRTTPRRDKRLINARRNVGVDQAFDQENISKMLEDVLREVDIYQNDITLMQNRFVSPLSRIAEDFYRFYITDTLTLEDGEKYVELSFSPKSPETFSFNGKLYVAAHDTTRFIKRVTMRVPRFINLNFVDNIFINQEFTKDSLGMRHKTLDDVALELQLAPGTQSFYARRSTAARNFSYEELDSLREYYSRAGNIFNINEDTSPPDALWNDMRIVPLSEAESNMGDFRNNLRKYPAFYWGEKILLVLVKGYVGTSIPPAQSRFDLGPVNTFLSFNDVEGVRLRLGGMTTSRLSDRLFARAYGAYGFKDHRWKYMGELEWSFNKKKYHSREFPIHSVRLSHKYDIDMLGQRYLFTNPDNIFLSLKRKENELATYLRTTVLEYTLELANNFSVNLALRNEIRFATPWVQFINGYGESRSHYSLTGGKLTLRYAPGESFIQNRSNRAPVNMDAPIFQISQEYYPSGIFNNAYSVTITEASVFKRFWFSAFGYADILVKGGKIWSKVQYPSLLWANANLSYTIQPESYSLLNPMEFANDWYASLDLTYWMNGLIFNRIPLVKKLKLREIFTFKLLSGGLSNKNNPILNEDLFRFPYGASTRPMSTTPYMEIGAGLDNIFKILRIDYVWRLTYRDVPAKDRSGLRISLHFSF